MKRTIFIRNRSYLRSESRRLVIERDHEIVARIPFDDIWVVIVDGPAVVLTGRLLSDLHRAGIGLLTCGIDHMPCGLSLPLVAHSRHAAMVEHQLAISKPLRKQLWKRIIERKIENQAAVLRFLGHDDTGVASEARAVRSGDTTNREAVAAARYFDTLIPEGTRWNSVYTPHLNYGYAILRAGLSQAAVSRGWLVSRGLFHHSAQNAFNLVDDMIEPFRPIVDAIAFSNKEIGELDTRAKADLVASHEILVEMRGRKVSAQLAASETFDSLKDAMLGEDPHLLHLPRFIGLERCRATA